MDRRQFFRRGLDKALKSAVKVAERKVEARAAHWIRPPFATAELEFLAACTRCGACMEACPEQVIFPLAARLGVSVAGTPALDLLNRACALCEGWPCVAACEPGALRLPEVEPDESPPLPKLARAHIDPGRCLPYSGPECGACRDVCPVPGAMVWMSERPVIEPGLCVGCAQCRHACVVSPKAVQVGSLRQLEEPATA